MLVDISVILTTVYKVVNRGRFYVNTRPGVRCFLLQTLLHNGSFLVAILLFSSDWDVRSDNTSRVVVLGSYFFLCQILCMIYKSLFLFALFSLLYIWFQSSVKPFVIKSMGRLSFLFLHDVILLLLALVNVITCGPFNGRSMWEPKKESKKSWKNCIHIIIGIYSLGEQTSLCYYLCHPNSLKNI